MSVKRRDELDLVQYRLDTLERRLESVERTLLSKTDSGSINTELLNIVLNMVRGSPSYPSPAKASTEPPDQLTTTTPDACDNSHSTVGKSFIFDRRKTVV